MSTPPSSRADRILIGDEASSTGAGDETEMTRALRLAVERTFGAGALDLLSGDRDNVAAIDASTNGVEAQKAFADLVARIDREVQGQHPAPTGPPPALTRRVAGVASVHAKFVVFSIANLDCAVPLANVLEIQRPPRVTPIPNLPGWVLGVANLRGDIISVVDLRGFFGLESIEYERSGRIMVVRSSDQELTTGLIVDRVSGMAHLASEHIYRPNALMMDRITPFVRGVAEDADRLLIVLDLDALLNADEMRQFHPH